MSAFTVREYAHFLHLQFHEPSSANALSLASARELSQIQRSYRKWQRPLLVTSGHPTMFCSGGNLSDYKKLKTKAAGLKINREITKILHQFTAWPVVKLAVVEGDVWGGGMEWLSCFHFRWSTPHALFGFWQKRIGLSTGWGGGARWSARLGEIRFRQLLVGSELLTAEAAYAQDLVDRVICAWKIREAAENSLKRMDSDPQTMRELLQWKSRQESEIFQTLWMGPAHSAALKRWKG